MNKTTLMNSIKIMLLVVVSGIILFLVCSGGGRLMILFNLILKPFIWVYTFPVVGLFISIITGLVIYAVLLRSPSPEWKKNERYIFISALFISAGGWLASVEYAGIMFLLTCLVGASYPIIQIVRLEIKGWKVVTDVLK